MRRGCTGVLAALLTLAAAGQGAAKEEIVLPSGLQAYLLETRADQLDSALIVRFRFVAEAFTGQEEFELQTADLEFLCNDFALAAVKDLGDIPSRVVISLADQPSEFGQFDPDVAQIFESFSVDNDSCILELF